MDFDFVKYQHVDNKISKFTVSFSKNSMQISNGIVSQFFNHFKALQLLNKTQILIGDEDNIFSIHGEDMKILHTAIENNRKSLLQCNT